MSVDEFDWELEEQRKTLADTIAWDEVYARATAKARANGFAQFILERGPSDYH